MKRVLALLLASNLWANAQTNGFDFADAELGASLHIPAGWVAIPKEMLYEVAGYGAKLEPTPAAREWLAAYQRANTNGLRSTFPKILVQYQKGSPLTEMQFEGIHVAPLVEINVAQSLGFAGKPEFMKSAHYDKAKQCLEFDFDCQVPDNGRVVALGRSFLTDQGVVNIYCYAAAYEFSAVRPEFEKILTSFRLPAGRRYQPQVVAIAGSNGNETLKTFGSVLGLMGIVGIVYLLLRRWRDTVWSDEI